MDVPVSTSVAGPNRPREANLLSNLRQNLHECFFELGEQSLPAGEIENRMTFLKSLSFSTNAVETEHLSEEQAQKAYESCLAFLRNELGQRLVQFIEDVSNPDNHKEGKSLSIPVDWELATLIELVVDLSWGL